MSSGKTGDWAKVEQMFSGIGERFKANVEAATNKNGRLLEATMVGHFEKQDLGWQPLKPATAKRKARKGYSEQILIQTATLMGNIRFQRKRWDGGFVGVNRGVKTKGGEDVVNIAAVHEFGSPKRNIPARPFMAPSATECAGPMIKNYEDAVEKTFQP